MNDLISLGVDGFRIDAAKHMDTNDIAAIRSRLSNPGVYIYQEVIESSSEPIKASEYFKNGDVTEFRYSTEIGRVFKTGQLSSLSQFGEPWGFMPSDPAEVFVDNHDNQRGHGGGGSVVTHKDGQLYNLASYYMLAWPYGYPQVMSSYHFSNPDQGPPSNDGNTTRSVWVQRLAHRLQLHRVGLRTPPDRDLQHGVVPQRHRGSGSDQLVEQRVSGDRLQPGHQGLRRHQPRGLLRLAHVADEPAGGNLLRRDQG